MTGSNPLAHRRSTSLWPIAGDSSESDVCCRQPERHHEAAASRAAGIDVALLTGGFDRPYAFGISTALAAKGVRVDVVGSNEVDSLEMHSTPGITFHNFQPEWRHNVNMSQKVRRVLVLYARLLTYAFTAKPRLFHILWNNKVAWFDRTLLMLYLKSLRKRIALTAHNVNTAKRDGGDSWFNRFTLKAQYRLVDHVFVHTQAMRCELVSQFGVRPEAISVIPFGINNAVPRTPLTPAEAKQKLQVDGSERAVLFFGRIQPYKGMQYLVEALESLVLEGGARYRLIVAGQPKKEHVRYWSRLQARIANGPLSGCVLQRIEYIPDDEVETYFKAADVLVLPYTDIYESGVLYLSYSFGLPVIATDVGSFRDEIVHGETGLICRCSDSSHLARTIEEYFASPLYARLDGRRQGIQEYAHTRHSWDTVADLTVRAYRGLLTARP